MYVALGVMGGHEYFTAK